MKKFDEEKFDAQPEESAPVEAPKTEAPKKVSKAPVQTIRPGMMRVRMIDTGKVSMYSVKTARMLISRKRAERAD